MKKQLNNQIKTRNIPMTPNKTTRKFYTKPIDEDKSFKTEIKIIKSPENSENEEDYLSPRAIRKIVVRKKMDLNNFSTIT